MRIAHQPLRLESHRVDNSVIDTNRHETDAIISMLQMKSTKTLVIIFCLFCTNQNVCLVSQETKTLWNSRIAFGSCARERQQQPVWNDIIAKQPGLFLMIGDNQYADFWMKDGEMVMQPVPNVERIAEAYQALAAKPGFIKLRQRCEIMATWDDHDYGANDHGKEFRLRDQSQIEFARFFGFPPGHPIHQQQGVYHSRTFGPPGQRVQVIMLDTRYHRDPLERGKVRLPDRGPYVPTKNVEKSVLGEAQWVWLEKQLNSPAEIRIIASSIQVVSDEHGWETWGNFPHERQRLFNLIEKTQANGVVFVSGDRHLMEISCDDLDSACYPIWDFTSSGLTQKKETVIEANRHRIGPVHREQNFGMIEIDWRKSPESTRIHLQGFGSQGRLLTRQTVLLKELVHDSSGSNKE